MSREFKLKDPGEGIHEAEIIEIQVSPGDEVRDGDVLFVVDTDKAAVEVPAPFDGTVEEIRVEEGDVAEVGDVLLTYTPSGEEEAAGEEKEGEESGEEQEKKRSEEAEYEDEEEAEEEAEDEDEEEAEGEDEEEAEEQAEEEPEKEAEKQADDDLPVPASPATRRLARELEVDLREVPGSGEGGRVTSDDVRQFAEEGRAPEEEAEEEAEEKAEQAAPEEAEERPEEKAFTFPFHTLVKKPPRLPDFSHWGSVRREPLRRIRRNVAQRMTMAWWEIPHVNHHEELDITELERFRKEHEGAVEEEGGRLTLTILIMKAAVAALKAHPRFNASLDVEAEEIVLKDYYNLGLAVDTDEGLVVPVIRNVDGKSLVELSVELVELVERVKDGKLSQEDVQGGTFTLTNPGPLGGVSFTPLLRYPEVAILGMAAAHLKPVVQGDLEEWEIVPRLVLPLVLAFDHRVNDGADAARFMNTLMETLSDVDSFLLNA
jgi:pyruvate dehydrogenase E2 component (dihydrolipoamide acetyltransferase)